MTILPHITLPLLLMAALTSCALPGSISPNTTHADELVKKLGKPTETRAAPQGGEVWDYVYGPAGTETWRFAIDGGRVVRSKEQLLTHERLYKVVPGTTTQAQVLDLLGKPGGVSDLALGPSWEWRVNLNPEKGYFVVNFDRQGIATGIAVLMDMRIDSGDKGDR